MKIFKKKDDLNYLSQAFDNNVLNLIKREGFYPYEYMSDSDSLLADKKNSCKGYEYVLNVWKKFQMNTMKDYHDLYLKWDVLLLTDVFENFRNNSLMNYGLCPSHYLSVPALSWDAILNMTKMKLEFISDPWMRWSFLYF